MTGKEDVLTKALALALAEIDDLESQRKTYIAIRREDLLYAAAEQVMGKTCLCCGWKVADHKFVLTTSGIAVTCPPTDNPKGVPVGPRLDFSKQPVSGTKA